MSIIQEGQNIDKYTVQSFIKEGEFDETYRVANEEGTSLFMKLFDMAALPSRLKTEAGEVAEIACCEKISHPVLLSLLDRGAVTCGGKEYRYMITPFLSGGLVAEQLNRGQLFPWDEAVTCMIAVLQGLAYLHKIDLCHNDISPRNIMLRVEDGHTTPVIIDMGHASDIIGGNPPFPTDDLMPQFRAPETYKGFYSPRSDLFSAAAVLYAMLYGSAPWCVDLSSCNGDRSLIKVAVKKARNGELLFDDSIATVPDWLKAILKKALSVDDSERFETAQSLIEALQNHSSPANSPKSKSSHSSVEAPRQDMGPFNSAESENRAEFKIEKAKGNGFSDIAGMEELKEMMRRKVIFVLTNQEKAKKYKLTPPNGMLLYGPPGCGKTFFAQKFAEETGYYYSFVKASDLGSIYVHGTQGKISQLFDEAKKNTPSILCFDEFDAMVPVRQGGDSNGLSSEVNEFLSQLNNCSHQGLFVIGTTNRPDRIDPAVLRKGRMDVMFYVPLPDIVARKALFELYLKDRPCEAIDLDELAAKTENYVSSDISYVVNDASMVAAYQDVAITQKTLLDSISFNKPSLSQDTLKNYEQMHEKMEGLMRENTRKPIGFI